MNHHLYKTKEKCLRFPGDVNANLSNHCQFRIAACQRHQCNQHHNLHKGGRKTAWHPQFNMLNSTGAKVPENFFPLLYPTGMQQNWHLYFKTLGASLEPVVFMISMLSENLHAIGGNQLCPGKYVSPLTANLRTDLVSENMMSILAGLKVHFFPDSSSFTQLAWVLTSVHSGFPPFTGRCPTNMIRDRSTTHQPHRISSSNRLSLFTNFALHPLRLAWVSTFSQIVLSPLRLFPHWTVCYWNDTQQVNSPSTSPNLLLQFPPPPFTNFTTFKHHEQKSLHNITSLYFWTSACSSAQCPEHTKLLLSQCSLLESFTNS